MDFSEFRKEVLKMNEHRTHKINNSLGVYDAYKFIRKNKWFNIGRPLTEHEFYSIIRKMNEGIRDAILSGNSINLPLRMGRLDIRKFIPKCTMVGNKLKNNMPIDWDATLKLWYEDEESYTNKVLVRCVEREVFQIYYDKSNAIYNNKMYYRFEPHRFFKRSLKDLIKNGNIDAYLI